MRFAKLLLHFRYENQLHTCRHCHQTGHYASACHTVICFNCEQTGHLASDCPEPLLCNICKTEEHTAKDCPFSWARVNEETSSSDETPPSTLQSNNTPPDNDASEDENKPMDSDDESQITATSGNPPDFFTPEQTDSESATAQLVNSNQPSTAESLPATQLLKLLMLQLRPGN